MTELKRSLKQIKKNMMLDLHKIFEKEWTFEYKSHIFVVQNYKLEEKVFIDNNLVANKKHKSVWTQIKRYVTLKATVPSTGEIIVFKIGGHNSMTCIAKVGKETIFYDKSKITLSPWENKQPILSFLLEALEKKEALGSMTLPDEEYYYLDEDEPRYALGLRLQYTELSEIAESESKSLMKKLHKQLKTPTLKNREALYEKVMDEDYIEYDRYFIELAKFEQFDEKALKEEAMWFIEHATHRYAFIFGLTILRYTDCKEQLPLLKQIALHEDFTLYVLDIIEKQPNPNEEIFKLAKKVSLWGRIFAVNLLQVDNKEKVDWLITDGYKGIFPELFADKANIMHLLQEGQITDAQYEGIGHLLIDMIERQGIDSYDRSSDALLSYVKQGRNHAKELSTLYPIAIIQLFLRETDWEERYEAGWKPIDRILIEKETQAILKQTNWQPIVLEELAKNENLDIPITIAASIELNIAKELLEKVDQGIFDDAIYEELMESGDEKIAKQVVNYLEEHVDFFKATEKQAQCIYSVVHSLGKYEGIGTQLMENLLSLEEQSIEHAILETLIEWGNSQWLTAPLRESLQQIQKNSSDKELKQMAKQILSK